MIRVYIDGSSKGNPGPAGAGIGIYEDGRLTVARGIPLGHVTNNRAEFMALTSALSELVASHANDEIEVLTDSRLVVGILGMGWKAKANLDLVMQARTLMGQFSSIKLTHVKGHNGEQGNEMADRLAQEAADSQEISDYDYSRLPMSKRP